MRYRRLGPSGLFVSELSLGTMTFGGSGGIWGQIGQLQQEEADALVRAALERAERVVVTLFVNPRQFNSPEDLAAYPRTEAADAALLAPLGADLLYVPDGAEMYPPGFATTVSVGGIGSGLCDAFRPGHFEGVATVVTKLLNQARADVAAPPERWMEEHHAYTFLLHETIQSICGSAITVLDFGRGNVTFKQRRGFTATDQWTPVFVTAEDPRIESELVKMDTTIAQMLGQPA